MTGKEHWQRCMGSISRGLSSTTRGLEYQERRDKQLERSKNETERLDRQNEAALERMRAAIKRTKAIKPTKAVTEMDKVEMKKISTQYKWYGKWTHRKLRLDARRR